VLGAEKRAGHVDREHRVVALDRNVEELAAGHDAGVVDQDVQPAEAGEDAVDHGAYVIRARDIGAHGLGPPSQLLQLAHDVLRAVGAGVVVHRAVGALASEGQRDRAAESATGSSDQRNATIKTSHATILV
jgi:hypothetical protein